MNKSPSFLRPDEVVVSPSDVAEDILTTAGAIALITLMEVTGVEHVWAGGRAVDDMSSCVSWCTVMEQSLATSVMVNVEGDASTWSQ